MTLPYENGKRQGFSMYYDEDGDIYRTSIFIDNQYCGSRQMSYYEKGVVSCECDIEGYLPDGGTEAIYMCEVANAIAMTSSSKKISKSSPTGAASGSARNALIWTRLFTCNFSGNSTARLPNPR